MTIARHRRRRLHRLAHRAHAARPGPARWSCSTRWSSATVRAARRRAGRRQHPRPRARHRAVPRPRRRPGRPLRRLQGVGESMEQPERYWLNNVAGSVDLVEAMLAAGVTRARVLVELLGERHTRRRCRSPRTRRSHPESVYAETKAMVERMLGWYGVTSGFRGRQPALLQRRRRQHRAAHRRGLDPLAEPGPAGDEGHAGQAAAGAGLRHRLPHPRRHLHPRLHPRRRPGRRPHPRPRLPRATAARPCRSTSAPASAAACSTSSTPPNGSAGRRVPYEVVGRARRRPGGHLRRPHQGARHARLDRHPRRSTTIIDSPPGRGTRSHPDGFAD